MGRLTEQAEKERNCRRSLVDQVLEDLSDADRKELLTLLENPDRFTAGGVSRALLKVHGVSLNHNTIRNWRVTHGHGP